jgi:hypothetical protein
VEGLPINVEAVTQIVHPHSSAYFVNTPKHILRCLSESVELQVGVQGSGPWILKYVIIFRDKTEPHTLKIAADESQAQFSLSNLEKSGVYVVALVEITDSNGCSKSINTESVNIEVLPSRPTVSFQDSKPLNVIEGSRPMLDLYLAGRGPFVVYYKNTAKSETVLSQKLFSNKLQVSEIGEYQLVGIEDSVCKGSVTTPNIINGEHI